LNVPAVPRRTNTQRLAHFAHLSRDRTLARTEPAPSLTTHAHTLLLLLNRGSRGCKKPLSTVDHSDVAANAVLPGAQAEWVWDVLSSAMAMTPQQGACVGGKK